MQKKDRDDETIHGNSSFSKNQFNHTNDSQASL